MPASLSEPLRRARSLILEHGRSSTAYQILNLGFELWFSKAGDAVVGYVARHNVRVAGGNPVCPESRLSQVVDEFTKEAYRHGDTVAFFGADSEVVQCIGDVGEVIAIGSEPSWRPADWQRVVRGKASVRAQIHRATNKGVEVTELEGRALAHGLLRSCLDEWLETRPMPPLHFLVEPQTLVRVADRRIFVARRAGRVVGFLVASPIPARRGWLVEQIVRGYDAPNGTAELLFHAALSTMGGESWDTVTFGLAPLSRRAWGADTNPAWIRILFALLRSTGAPFYHFEGLEAFKAKLRPDSWETIYLATPDTSISLHTFLAIASAFSEQPLGGLTIGAVGRLGRSLFEPSFRGAISSGKGDCDERPRPTARDRSLHTNP